jgi:hypothetical protein
LEGDKSSYSILLLSLAEGLDELGGGSLLFLPAGDLDVEITLLAAALGDFGGRG